MQSNPQLIDHSASYSETLEYYDWVLNNPKAGDYTYAELGKQDRYFLLVHLLRRYDAIHPWLFERCREVEANTDGCLDLWAREHYKSTIITFAGIIQEVIKDPEITIGIFSHTRPIAKGFLGQIMTELEQNDVLKQLYPDVFWENPRSEAGTWSLDGGLLVKRKENPKEKTIESWGLVDGQPTSKHFKLMVYDDVVTVESVTSPEMIQKTTERWELSRNLSAKGKNNERRVWYIGTRYNYADTYKIMLERDIVTPRIYPATDNGSPDGEPIFLSQKEWDDKKKESSLYTIACQMLQNPNAGSEQEFKPEYLRYYELRPKTLNVYILCDYAGSRKSTGSSNTAYAVIGVDHALNKYLLDGMCHKMTLTERWENLKLLQKKWIRQPGVQIVSVGYERFGAQSDIEHFETMMDIEKYHFPIEELNWPRDGDVAKDNRIRRLEPDFRNWRFFLPYSGDETTQQRNAKVSDEEYLVAKKIKRKNHEGRIYDLVEWFIQNEYLFFPNTTMKDFLDAMSRIYDMEATAPIIMSEDEVYPEYEED